MYLFSCITGTAVGIVIYTFLEALEIVTEFRGKHSGIMLAFLPLFGLLTAFAHKKISLKIPAAAPAFIYVFSVLSHLFGASVGRECAGVKIGAGMSRGIGKLCRVPENKLHIAKICGMSAGFAAVFGTPLAGVFFGMEYKRERPVSANAVAPAAISSIAANAVVQLLGHEHSSYIVEALPAFTAKTAAAVCIAVLVFIGAGKLFGFCTARLKKLYERVWENEYLCGFCAAAITTVAAFSLGLKEYGGLSPWLISAGFDGAVTFIDPLKKFVFTALSIGGGLIGGEVTPMFCIGSSLGGAFANVFGQPPSFLAAVGLVTVFGAFMKTPVSAAVLGVELFIIKGIIC